MKVLIAEKKDLKAILDLQKACYLEEAELYNDFLIPPLIQTLESITFEYIKGIILKIESNGRIVGSVRGIADSKTCKIGKLIVDKEFRHQGLGTKLTSAIERLFKHVRRFELFTGHKSVRNLSLYQKLGYKEFKRESVNDKLEFVFLEKMNFMLNI